MVRYPPPQTVRPSCPVVEVLERDPSGAAFLEHMRELLDPGDRAVDTPNGFWWAPHRTRHLVELVELPDADGNRAPVIRSEITLVVDIVDDVNAVASCHYLNQRSFGGAVWFDAESRSIRVTSAARLWAARWFDAEVFELTVPRLVGICERLAPMLAERVTGRVPDPEHPQLGRRIEPDQLVLDVERLGDVPETTTGTWWSPREVRAFRSAVRHVLGERGAEPDAALLDPDEYDRDLTSARNLAIGVTVPTAAGTSWLTVAETEHPDFGRVFETLHVSPVRFEGAGPDEGPPVSGLNAIIAVNELNAASATSCPHRLLVSGFTTWRGQLCRSTVLLPEVTRIVQNLAHVSVGEVFGLLAVVPLEQHDFAMALLDYFDDDRDGGGGDLHGGRTATRWW